MARTRVSRDLGPLPARSALRTAYKSKTVRQILHSLAIKNQTEQSRIFYSLREVAARFKVPVSAVAKIYRDMESEGLLSRVRGSKTILNGMRYSRRPVRAVVGLPAVFSNFIAIPEYRNFFTSIQRELWLRGFATTTVLFQPEEVEDGSLSERLKNYEIDSVIWLQPGPSARHLRLRLMDQGIRVIIISQIGTPPTLSRYYLWKERAIEKLLREWKERNSVRRVIVVNSEEYRAVVIEEILRIVLGDLGLDAVTRTLKDEAPETFLRQLSHTDTDGVIFASAGLASMFSFRCCARFVDLLRTHRVALIDGPIDLAFARVPDALFDLVTIDWKAVAESIVNDMITLQAFDQNRHTTFTGECYMRVPISKFCESVRPIVSSSV